MKKLTILAALAALTFTFAQTVQAPLKINWKHALYWDDPNLPGTVASYHIIASNTLAVRTYSTATKSVAYTAFMVGAPAGTYTVTVTPIDTFGDDGTTSTNHYIVWPGGDGKPGGPTNLRSLRN